MTVRRCECGQVTNRDIVVFGLVLDAERKNVLLGLNSEGKWSLPGKSLEWDETFEGACDISVKAQCGLSAYGETFLTLGDSPYIPQQQLYFLYWIRKHEGDAKGANGFSEVRWFNLRNLPNDTMVPLHKDLISTGETILGDWEAQGKISSVHRRR